MNSNYIQADKFDFKLFLLLSAILLISPIVGLFLSIICFRQKASAIIFILFSFYFGWFYEPQFDLLNHYNHFKSLIGKSLFQQWTDLGTLGIGKEPYPVLFKYIVGLISDSPNFFSACACLAYSTLFILFINRFRDLFTKKINILAFLAFLGIVFTVEFYWFLGFRYWSGAFVFSIFYIQYIRTEEKKYLYLTLLCNLFHFAHFTLCLAAFANEIIKNRFFLRYILVGISFIFRFLEIDLIPLMAKIPFLNLFVKKGMLDSEIITSIAKRTEFFREQGNQVYWLRNDILFWGCIIALLLLFKNLKNIEKNYPKLWGLIMITFAFANISYMDMTVYLRIFKFTNLMLFVFLFLSLCKSKIESSKSAKLISFLILSSIVFFAFLTPIVEHRKLLFSIELWFNNLL